MHKEHCCLIHGCKYGDKDCPVENAQVLQESFCEDCANVGIKSVTEVIKIHMKKTGMEFIPVDDRVPEYIPIDDPRTFMILNKGGVYTGYHITGSSFKTGWGVIAPEAWVEWTDAKRA